MSRAFGKQVWPTVRHVVGDGTEAVTSSEYGDSGEVIVRGSGVRRHDDGTVTIAGPNVEVEADGTVLIRGTVVK